MKVKDVMHKGVDWVSPDTPVTELAKLMREHDIGASKRPVKLAPHQVKRRRVRVGGRPGRRQLQEHPSPPSRANRPEAAPPPL